LKVTTLETDKRSFKKKYPNLSKDLQDGKVTITAVPTDPKVAENSSIQHFQHYNPTVIDFIRRCDKKEQAAEIIAYLEKKGKLTKEFAKALKEQLKKRGLRSFGSKKEDDYYVKKGSLG